MVSRELKDPRIPPLTFTAVEVSQDGSQAVVYVSILGGGASTDQMKECLEGLKSSSGFLRRHLASVLTIRHVPQLLFKEDRGIENASRVYTLLKTISKNEFQTPSRVRSPEWSAVGQ